jgi:hypothetical protein
VYPGKQVPTVLYWSFKEVYLRTQAVIWNQDDPESFQTVFDLIHVDHARRTKHEGTAMDVNDCKEPNLVSLESQTSKMV